MSERVVVLGAGYAGLAAAKLAARWTGAEVTLVNERDRFVQRVRLHQVAAGQVERRLPLWELLAGSGVELVVGRAEAIDLGAREVRVGDRALPYDRLVYALGSTTDLGSAPGVAEHAHSVSDAESAERLHRALTGRRSVVVVGGGLTGVETAAELAEAGHDVSLLSSSALGAGLSAKAVRHLHRALARLGVRVREGCRVESVDERGLRVDGGHEAADAVVWTAGFRVPPLARESGLAVDASGRLLVDEAMRSTSHPEVIGVGDAAAVRRADGREMRMACATAAPNAQRAIRSLAQELAGDTPTPTRFRYVGQCVSLGRRDAVLQFVHADDTPRDVVLTGRAAALAKEMIIKYTVAFQRRPTMPSGA
ncbi:MULTISPECIES: NAD(P)/FAD-dependent oxidoreductase [Actinosynnema]|uniref:NAD(P)/FAD-dependent oxidoreductase n=1 Tax=Actinosynnema TaxID=40566 RepID=UPI0020A5C8FC|nr:FAD-dependent oxidoreductase [Actinosynnema pretiosum]MCP2093930.1 NADH dehydrogenase, FAD-containing subunit [Actinosynnema pretiosum]